MTSADVIVVLGCTLAAGGVPTPALSRRVALAARAFREGMAPRIIASGGRRWGEHVEAVAISRALASAGIPENAVLLELCSLTTLENGHYTAELMGRLGIKRALITTCAWHLPRALANFRRFGVDAVGPPPSWLDGRAVPLATRIRERLCQWADSAMMRQNP